MPDTKITALTAITTVDPAVDVLPIVDVSDTTMAASGTTKKITSNQILGAGGTATLASATITGDLTVDTNTLKVVSSLDFVGIGATTQSFGEKLRINGNYTVMNDGTFTGFLGKASAIGASGATADFGIRSENDLLFLTNGANLRMTLNSTGLGVGVSPAQKLDIIGSLSTRAATTGANQNVISLRALNSDASAYANALYYANSQQWHYNGASLGMALDSSGNVISNVTGTAPTLAVNSQMVFNLTSNTNLRISVRGTDGVTRVHNLTLT